MTRKELNDLYFEWMYQLVDGEGYSEGNSYRKLFKHLHKTEFIFSVPMDGNRADDGTDLRYRFAYENSHDNRIITTYLDDRPCSVLEMMVALSLRCEEDIMDDPDIGDRTGEWFWGMVQNLGLDLMDDSNFDAVYTDDIISRFLEREYSPDGNGGLFTVENCKYDLRDIEIWYQMCWYMDNMI